MEGKATNGTAGADRQGSADCYSYASLVVKQNQAVQPSTMSINILFLAIICE